MIYNYKIKRLSPDELTVLLYCVNDGNITNPFINEDNITCVRESYAFKMLNEYAGKLKSDKKRGQIQAIADKIINT
jgi:hypothetical protein